MLRRMLRLGIRNLWGQLLCELYVRLFVDVYGLFRLFW
ncbi:hypothetical protein pEaSNUABM8_00193 [Erwinia phage pEa_SNUABM_8]|nr:hypothetical protein pEaSNUABM8_00193 [Erwinia phage pEa_SNUABM_8]QVW54945.1 hypothetical protein pEaSNUABM4_00192 [Erwinia phage pEa_SNUABM_4]